NHSMTYPLRRTLPMCQSSPFRGFSVRFVSVPTCVHPWLSFPFRCVLAFCFGDSPCRQRSSTHGLKVGVEFFLGADPANLTPVAQDAGTDVGSVRPNQSAILEDNLPELPGSAQDIEHRPVECGR